MKGTLAEQLADHLHTAQWWHTVKLIFVMSYIIGKDHPGWQLDTAGNDLLERLIERTDLADFCRTQNIPWPF